MTGCIGRNGHTAWIAGQLAPDLAGQEITAPFPINPTAFKMVENANIFTTNEPSVGSTNCGNKASTKSAIFGFNKLLTKPCRRMRNSGVDGNASLDAKGEELLIGDFHAKNARDSS